MDFEQSIDDLLESAEKAAYLAKKYGPRPLQENDRLGQCYVLSGRYVISNPDAILVHGHIYNPFSKGLSELDHAWVVEGDVVYDPVMDKRFPKFIWDQLFNAVEYNRYTHEEVLENILKYEHWGPWDE